MKRRVLSLALAVLMLFSLLPVSAMADGEISGTYTDDGITYTLENGVLTVSGAGECSSAWKNYFDNTAVTSVVIKEGITSISGSNYYNSAFRDCSSLTSVTIPNSVTSIGNYAFIGCSSLTSVAIPNSVTSIGNYAFEDCSSLTSVAIPNSVTSIGDYAFIGCSSLTSVAIPNSVTSIGDYAFEDCGSLTEINVSTDNASYSSTDGVLYNKEQTKLIQCPSCKSGSFTIPDSVTHIGSAFYGCSLLTSITIPDSVVEIDSFARCSSLTSISVGSGVSNIAWSAFVTCSSLKEITVSVKNASYSSIDGVLYNKEQTELICCPQAKSGSVYIPDGVTEIEYKPESMYGGAFDCCHSLTSISIPASVTSIDGAAFSDCSSLTEINVSAENQHYSSIDGVVYNKEQTELIRCPGGKTGSLTIPDSVTNIGYSAFHGCHSLTSITIPDSATNISYYAFSGCTSLTSIAIPDSVTSIYVYAFYDCTSLTDVYYSGTEEQWNAISIDTGWDGNDCLTNATIHYNYQPHVHAYTDTVTAPTCTDKGYTTHSCACGDSYVDTYVDALGHDYKDGACTVCGAADPDYKEPTEPTPAVKFTDVPDSAYYAEPVAWAVEKGITGGYNDGTFKPMDICTRAQIVTFIWRANNCPEPAGTSQGFTDVKEGTYYYKAVLWAAEQGITGGFNDGGFHPDELVTRAQAMTFLWRANGKPAVPEGTVNTFKDVPATAYYHDAVLWAVANGVTGGYDANTFGSMDGCTRAQIVTFLYRDMA